jgi:predicted helicase
MTTVEKGDAFEDRVYRQFEEELKNDKLHVPSGTGRLFKKKGYFSRDRNSDIVFDLSIETWLPGADNYSLLTLVECKDYSHSIPVDDIEEFHTKVRQVTGANVKAIFVTNSSLQSGALQYAKSNKIALIRILPDNQIKWDMHFIVGKPNILSLDPNEFMSAFLNMGHISRRGAFYGRDDRYIFGNLSTMLRETLQ